MLFRDDRPQALPLNRFRPDAIPFAFAATAGGYVGRVVPAAEIAVDLLRDLSEHLGPALTVTVHDRRHRERWAGEGIALPDARDGVSRMRLALVRFGGVDVTLDDGDQALALTAHLELELRATTDRWYYVLAGLGLVEAPAVPRKRWIRREGDWTAEPEVQLAVAHGVERMGLAAAR